jgi:dTMP kinase
MDLGMARDMFDSFVKYQTSIQETFRRLQDSYGFTFVDGNRSTETIHAELQKKISAVLAGK